MFAELQSFGCSPHSLHIYTPPLMLRSTLFIHISIIFSYNCDCFANWQSTCTSVLHNNSVNNPVLAMNTTFMIFCLYFFQCCLSCSYALPSYYPLQYTIFMIVFITTLPTFLSCCTQMIGISSAFSRVTFIHYFSVIILFYTSINLV